MSLHFNITFCGLKNGTLYAIERAFGTLLTIKETIMFVLNLEPLFKARNIEKPYTFLVNNGFTHHSAIRLTKSKVIKVMRMEHIERLCRILRCMPQDFLQWKQDTRNPMDALQPMHKWNRALPNISWEKTFTDLSFEDLEELARLARKKKHGNT